MADDFVLPIEQEQYWIDRAEKEAIEKENEKRAKQIARLKANSYKLTKRVKELKISLTFPYPVLYIINPVSIHKPVKLGISNKPGQRLSCLQVGNWNKLEIYKLFRVGKAAAKLEHHLHKHLAAKRLIGEWFDIYTDEADEIVKEFFKDNFKLFEGR